MKLLSAALWAGLLLGQTALSLSVGLGAREDAAIAPRGAAAELGERNIVVDAAAAAGGPAPELEKREMELEPAVELEPAGENLQRRRRPCYEDSWGVVKRFEHPYLKLFDIQKLANGRWSMEGYCRSWVSRVDACTWFCYIKDPPCAYDGAFCCIKPCYS